MNGDLKYVCVIVYKVISTEIDEYIPANLIQLSNNHARSRMEIRGGI